MKAKFLFLVFAFFLLQQKASACCSNYAPIDSVYSWSSSIFIGKVLKNTQFYPTEMGKQLFDFVIIENLKGNYGDTLTVYDYDEGRYFQIGETYLVFAIQDGMLLGTDHCLGTTSLGLENENDLAWLRKHAKERLRELVPIYSEEGRSRHEILLTQINALEAASKKEKTALICGCFFAVFFNIFLLMRRR